MNTTKQLKSLLSEAYEVEAELNQIIEQCFKEIFKQDAIYALSLFEEDLQNGREYNGCLQGLEFYKHQIEISNKEVKERKEKAIKENENE